MRYTAFGEIRWKNGVTPTDYRYTGQLAEPSLGLDYYVARWYDPQLAHFTSPDSMIPDPGKAKSFDRYAYVNNNPVRYNDPSGHCPLCIIIGIPLAGFAIGAASYEIRTGTMWWSSPQAFEGTVNAGVNGAVVAMSLAVGVGEAVIVAQEAGPVINYAGAQLQNLANPLQELGNAEFPNVAGDPENITAPDETILHRPYIRQEVRQEVENRAPKTVDGKYIDPNTGEPIEGPYDLGHIPGHEYWREEAKAKEEGLTQQEFNDRMNNPDYYQLESPSSNRSHKFEMK